MRGSLKGACHTIKTNFLLTIFEPEGTIIRYCYNYNVLLHEDFEGKEKKDTWEVLKSDKGNGYGFKKGFLNPYGALNWQFRMPFTNQLPPGRLTGAVQLEFRYRIDRSKDDQSFLVGLGWVDGLVAEHTATVALNAGNLRNK